MTQAVRIRPFRERDATALHAALQESYRELRPWMAWCRPDTTVDDTREWLAEQEKNFSGGLEYEFAILGRADEIVGAAGLNHIDTINRRANLGYWVRTSACGHGVATAAVGLVRMWAMEHTDLRRLELIVALGNAASLRVAEKAGADREGTLRQRLVVGDDVYDAAVFSFVRPL